MPVVAEWTRDAVEDLDAIYFYIAHEAQRPATAKKNVLAIREQCDNYARLMSENNLLGTDRGDILPGVRSFAYKRWVVLFKQVPGTIRVLAVFDGSQQYESLFSGRNSKNG